MGNCLRSSKVHFQSGKLNDNSSMKPPDKDLPQLRGFWNVSSGSNHSTANADGCEVPSTGMQLFTFRDFRPTICDLSLEDPVYPGLAYAKPRSRLNTTHNIFEDLCNTAELSKQQIDAGYIGQMVNDFDKPEVIENLLERKECVPNLPVYVSPTDALEVGKCITDSEIIYSVPQDTIWIKETPV